MSKPTRCEESDETPGFLRLPDELLLHILFMSTDGVALAMTCRRFHFLVLPLLLELQGFPDLSALNADLEVLTKSKLVFLPLLRRVLFMKSLNKLAFSFQPLSTQSYGPGIGAEIEDLAVLIEHLEVLRSANVHCFGITPGLSFYGPPSGRVEYGRAYGRLFNAILARGAQDVTLQEAIIKHKGLPATLGLSPPPNSVVPPTSSLKRLTSKLRSWPRENQSPSPDRKKTYLDEFKDELPLWTPPEAMNVQTLSLFRCSIFYAPMFHWLRILTAACAPRLTTLHLLHLTGTSLEWEFLLESLSIPTLEDLAMVSCNIMPPDIIQFLTRHPSLRHLRISGELLRSNSLRNLNLPLAPNILPNLETLQTIPDYLFYLLTPRKSLPKLASIVYDHDPHIMDWGSLGTMGHRLRNPTCRTTVCMHIKNSWEHRRTVRTSREWYFPPFHKEIETVELDAIWIERLFMIGIFDDWSPLQVALRHYEGMKTLRLLNPDPGCWTPAVLGRFVEAMESGLPQLERLEIVRERTYRPIHEGCVEVPKTQKRILVHLT